jgi:serine/threonine protein kinase
LEELGRGAGGVVYKAIHVPTLTVVAVKQIYVEDGAMRRQVLTNVPRGAFGWSCLRLSLLAPSCAYLAVPHLPPFSLFLLLTLLLLLLLLIPFPSYLRISSLQMTHELSLFHAFNARPLQPAPPPHASAAAAAAAPPCRAVCRVVQLHDAFTDAERGSCVCLVLEFMAGGALDAPVQRRAPLTEPQLAHVAGSVCAGLADLRRRRLLHRDVKPSVGSVWSCWLLLCAHSNDTSSSVAVCTPTPTRVARFLNHS